MFTSHCSPSKPVPAQSQENVLIPSRQAPPFKQESSEQSLMFNSQRSPSKPVSRQSQLNALTRSVQTPPFSQGATKHSSISNSQKSPSNPASQLQVARPSASATHTAPLAHTVSAQGSAGAHAAHKKRKIKTMERMMNLYRSSIVRYFERSTHPLD